MLQALLALRPAERLMLEQQLCRFLKDFVMLFQDCAGTAEGILDD